jgi:HJR/Mrr/RecB family endonuclease
VPIPAEVSRENGKKGGRPKGAATKLTRSLANELVRQGFDGLSVMVDNMLFWKDKADKLGEQHEALIAKLNSLPAEKAQELEDALKDFNKVSAYYIAAREKSQDCARDVAPYTNPRLQAITVTKNSTTTHIKMELKSASDDAERAAYRGDVVPFVKRTG